MKKIIFYGGIIIATIVAFVIIYGSYLYANLPPFEIYEKSVTLSPISVSRNDFTHFDIGPKKYDLGKYISPIDIAGVIKPEPRPFHNGKYYGMFSAPTISFTHLLLSFEKYNLCSDNLDFPIRFIQESYGGSWFSSSGIDYALWQSSMSPKEARSYRDTFENLLRIGKIDTLPQKLYLKRWGCDGKTINEYSLSIGGKNNDTLYLGKTK